MVAADLPAILDMRLDRLGVRQLQTHHHDRVLAVRIATYVREQLLDHGVNLQKAIVADAGGEHDMIGDVVRRGHIQGLVSIVLKCRRLWSEKGKDVAREKQREKDVLKARWWRTSMQNNPGKWGGRAILLLNLEETGRLTSRCEVHLTRGSWEVRWGWRSSRLATDWRQAVKHRASYLYQNQKQQLLVCCHEPKLLHRQSRRLCPGRLCPGPNLSLLFHIVESRRGQAIH